MWLKRLDIAIGIQIKGGEKSVFRNCRWKINTPLNTQLQIPFDLRHPASAVLLSALSAPCLTVGGRWATRLFPGLLKLPLRAYRSGRLSVLSHSCLHWKAAGKQMQQEQYRNHCKSFFCFSGQTGDRKLISLFIILPHLCLSLSAHLERLNSHWA